MPFAVAITRGPDRVSTGGYREAPVSVDLDPQSWAAALAPLTEVTAYDLRMRLAGEAPWVIAHTREPDEAAALGSALRDRGFGAVACDVSAARPWSPAGDLVLAFHDDHLSLDPGGLRVPYAHLRVMVRATFDAERESEQVERVVVSRNNRHGPHTVDVSRFSYAREREQALYLFAGADRQGARLSQSALRPVGVEGLTSRERFDRAVDLLRSRAPQARFDDRLVARPRKRTSFSLAFVEGASRGSVSSNAAETDLAARLMAIAFTSGQMS